MNDPPTGTNKRSWLVALGMVAGLGVCLILVANCLHNGTPTLAPPTTPAAETGSGTTPTASSVGTPAAPPSADAKMIIHLIDVGQGAATLIEFSCAAILVDTGGETNDEFDSTTHLTTYLDAFFKRRPDLHETLALLVLTHPHIDHTRNAMEVWKRYHVQNVVTDGLTVSSGGKQEAALIDAADQAHIGDDKINEHAITKDGFRDQIVDPVACPDGDPDIRVLWGDVSIEDVSWGGKDLKNANNDSVVTKITLGKASFLVMGDMELAGIYALLRRYEGTQTLHADVLEVGHHGSYNATTKALLDAITPKIALISVGSPERRVTWSAWAYGHPRMSTIELLEAALTGERRRPVQEPVASGAKQFEQRQITAPIYATGWDGDTDVTMFADGRNDVKVHAVP